jgi:hypothetical protein
VVFLGGSILCSSQSDNDPQEDLSRCDNNQNTKVKVSKHLPTFLTTYLNHVWKFGNFS